MQSVEQWLADIERGDEAAVQQVWERYFDPLVQQARIQLQTRFRRVSDEEDVALSVLDSLCRGVRQRKFPRLDDRHDLWRLLLTLVRRKSIDRVAHERRQRRGGGHVRGDSALSPGAHGEALREPADNRPSPELAAIFAEELQHRLAMLDNQELQHVAAWKMEGLSNVEISQRLGCAVPTVERRLARIRAIWSQPEADK